MSTPTESRRIPPFGGFSPTFLRLEFRRMMRNRRTVIFTLVMPGVFFLLFGMDTSYKTQSAGGGTNVTAYIMISMAVYGAMIASTSGGAMVSTERAVGWSRQLRLTPLQPVAYVATKVLVAMTLGLMAIVVVIAVGEFSGARIPLEKLIEAGLLGWVCTFVLAAFGLFIGYLLPSDNVMQVIGPALALMAFAGGLFVPLDQFSNTFAQVAHFTPVYGVGVIARYPLGSEGSLLLAIVNVVAWSAVFVTGAAWRMSKDTSRV